MNPHSRSLSFLPALALGAFVAAAALTTLPVWASEASPIGLWKNVDEYVGGEILDPDNGKLYRSKVRLAGNGKKLSVRGYIGVPMLGRSQTWVRQE